jgi:hypothetical protein
MLELQNILVDGDEYAAVLTFFYVVITLIFTQLDLIKWRRLGVGGVGCLQEHSIVLRDLVHVVVQH